MKIKLVLSIAAFGLITACSEPGKNYIFVVDTSGSMTYKGNTIEKVKKQMPELLDIVKKGDSVTLIKFDEKPVVNDPIQINSEEDKKHILKEIQAIRAEGAYTDMSSLIETLKEVTQKRSLDEKSFIVVLSDGMDDPAPVKGGRNPIDLKQYQSDVKGPVNDYYIYYLSLGKTKSKNLEKGLKTVSSQVKTIEPKADHKAGAKKGESAASGAANDASDIGIGSVAADIRQKNVLFLMKDNLLLFSAIAGLFSIGLLFLLVNLFGKKKKLNGKLIYQTSDGKSYRSVLNLGKIEGGRLIIGSKRGSNLRISDLGIPREIVIKPGNKSGLNYLRPVGKSASLINFLDQNVKGRISYGDKFRIGNYIFEYNNDKEN